MWLHYMELGTHHVAPTKGRDLEPENQTEIGTGIYKIGSGFRFKNWFYPGFR